MDPMAQQAVDILKKHGKAMVAEMVVELLEPAVNEMVKKSQTPIDDVLAAAMLPALKAAMLDQLNKL